MKSKVIMQACNIVFESRDQTHPKKKKEKKELSNIMKILIWGCYVPVLEISIDIFNIIDFNIATEVLGGRGVGGKP